MQDWYDRAYRVRVAVDGVRRPVAEDRVMIRLSEAGEPMLFFDKTSGTMPDLAMHLKPGVEAKMRLIEPRPAEYKTGFLKSAYLAACLHLRGVPDLVSAREIREELLAARDARRRREVSLGHHARALGVFRTGRARNGPPLALLRSDEDVPRYLISLAGTILVDWPFHEVVDAL